MGKRGHLLCDVYALYFNFGPIPGILPTCHKSGRANEVARLISEHGRPPSSRFCRSSSRLFGRPV